MLLPLLIPTHSQGAPTDEPTASKAPAKSDRYMGNSADWIELRKKHEGDADNSYRRAQHLEARQLSKGAPGVRREGKTIVLKTHEGKDVQIDDAALDDRRRYYSYYDFVPALDAYVLHTQHYEGNSWLLVSRKNGTRVKISDLPVVSPDKRRFVTGSYDLDADYNPNEVVVWTINKDGSIKQEWKTEPREWGPTFLRWLSPVKFQVRCEIPHWDQDKPRPQAMARTFELLDGKWQQVGGVEKWK